jgi:hypothetical protein
MKWRKWQLEDYIVAGVAIALVLLLFFFLEGCKSMGKVEDTEFLWSDGKGCVLYAKNIQAMKAQETSKNLKFKDCEIIFNNDINEGEIQ